LLVIDNTLIEPSDLRQQTFCYGLPYGVFGIICWALTFSAVTLASIKIPIFSPWRWRRDYYKPQGLISLTIASAMILVPALYTGVRCHGEWEVTLIALG